MNSDFTNSLIDAGQSLNNKLSDNENPNVRGKHKHSNNKRITDSKDNKLDSSDTYIS